MFTHEANEDLLIRLRVEDPIDRIYKAFTNRCSKPSMDFEHLQVWESRTQWLNVLRGRLFDNSEAARQSAQDVRIGSAGQSSARTRVVPVNLVTGQFICHECGFAFATQAALKSHKYKIHCAEQDKKTRHAEIHKRKQHPATEHARDGMAMCKHCGHQFETWPAFTYHVNSRNCAETRFFYAQENNRDQLATLQDALTYGDELLQAATSLTWREMAELHVVKQHRNHCLECHHWCASPMYVKRRMKSKHPELTEIVQDVTAKIIQSDWAPKSPCRFCGQTFKNRRAHLSSCIGVFNGHYLLDDWVASLSQDFSMAAALEAAKELAQATSELDMIRALTPTSQATPAAPATSTEAPAPVPDQAMDASDKSSTRARTEDSDNKGKDRQAKWSRLASKGNQQGRGKGQSQNSSKWENWSNWKDQDKDKSDLNQLKQHVDMLTTLVLRQEHQLMINRQDTSYIIFIRTDVTPSLAVTSFNIGQSWKQAKTSNPESLKSHLASAPADVYDCGSGELAFRYPENGTGQGLGLDSGRPLHRSEMECGEEDAQGGQQDPSNPDSANPEPHSGGSQVVHGAVCNQSLPCNEALGVRLFESYVDNDAQNRTSNSRSQPIVEHLQQYCPDIGVASRGSLLQTRAAAEKRSGQQIGAGCRQTSVGLRLATLATTATPIPW